MKEFERNIIKIHGNKGKVWLQDLKGLVESIAKRHKLSNLKPFNELGYNYILSGFKEGQPVILKLSPDRNSLKQENEAIKAFAGFGGISIVAEEAGMLILKQAIPGESLKVYFPDRDEEAILIFCNLMRKLHSAPLPKAGIFPNVNKFTKVFNKDYSIPFMRKARYIFSSLLKSSDGLVLLHGDLHHNNILKDGDDWVAIDPKGLIGEPLYELAAFIRNPITELLKAKDTVHIIEERIASFSKYFGADKERISALCFVHSVLSWAWALEDGMDPSEFKCMVKVFERVLENGIGVPTKVF